jgi:hypothetical protein
MGALSDGWTLITAQSAPVRVTRALYTEIGLIRATSETGRCRNAA